MKKFVEILLVGLMLLSMAGMAEETELCLVSPFFQRAEYVGTETYDEGYMETLTYDDGMMIIELMGLDASPEAGYPTVGEGSFSDFLQLRYANVTLVEEIECDPVSGYPAQRLHLEAGSDEDTCIVDSVAVWTDTQTFVMILQTDADAFYGYVDGYEPGDAQAMIDELVASLEIFDAGASAAATYPLVADFCGGNPETNIRYYEMTSAEPFSIELLSQGLSELTGLDFCATGYIQEGEAFVDWQADSTLVAGLDDRVQNEEFFFFDVDSLSWFMMDSLYATICDNTGLDTVYYTMNGGEALCLPNLSVVQELPVDVPYMGSPFYYAHYDVQG